MIVTYIFAVMCMRVIQSVFSKRASTLIPDGIKSYLKYVALNYWLAAAFAAGLIIASRNFSGIDWFTILIAACSGAFMAMASLCSVKALTGGTIVLNSIFSTSGLIVPCVLGIFAFNEPLSYIQWICIILVLGSAYLLIGSSKAVSGEFTVKTFMYLICSFFSNGMVMFFQKLFGMLRPDGNVAMFSLLTFLIPAIVLTFMCVFIKSSGGKNEKFSAKLIRCVLYLAFAVFIIQQLVTILTPIMPSAVLFTLVNGGGTIIAAIVGAVVYGEKITVRSAMGIIIGITSLIMINSY